MRSENGFEAEIIADSICVGNRLTTFRLKYPRFIHSEFLRHRVFSRCVASSRAVPAKKIRRMVLENPVIPVWFGANQKGMKANKELTGWRYKAALWSWKLERYIACAFHWFREKIGLHKQITNRTIEPWLFVEEILSGTEFNNLFMLRDHKDAQPEFRVIASLMRKEYNKNTPNELEVGDWHLPFIDFQDKINYKIEDLKKISAARCARTSYYLHDSGKRSNIFSDIELCNRLFGSNPKHLSPSEHVAQATGNNERYGNFVGWKQYRKEFEDESGGDYMQDEIRLV